MKFLFKNVGPLDRGVRIIVGLLLILAAAFGTLGLWAYVGIIPLVTGLVGICPVYSLLGFDTNARSEGFDGH